MYKMYEVDSMTLEAKNHSEDSNICGWYEAYASENLGKLKTRLRNIDRKEPVKFFLKKENADRLRAAMEAAKDEEAPADYKAKIAAEKEKEKEREIKKCENLIAKCEEAIKNQGRLKTKDEAKKWLRNYNNVMNEGGEGFLPRVYTQEEYEVAKKRLAELKG